MIDISEDKLKWIVEKISNAKKNKELISNNKLNKLNPFILDTIKKYKCIVYGGTAMHYNIMDAQKKLGEEPTGIYDKDKIADYDVIHYDYVNIGEEIADNVYSAGFRYVACKRGMHVTTYKLVVDFLNAMDISYVPKKMYEKLLSESLEIDGVHYIHPTYIKKDLYRNCAQNFFYDSWRIPKALKRIELLEKYFPINENKSIKKSNENIKKSNENKKLKNKKSKNKKGGNSNDIFNDEIYICYVDCHEIYSFRPSETIKKIAETSGKKVSVVNKRIPYLSYDGNYYECTIEEKLMFRIYYIDTPIKIIQKNNLIEGIYNFNFSVAHHLFLSHMYAKLWIFDDPIIKELIGKKLGEKEESEYNLAFNMNIEILNFDDKFIPPTYIPGKKEKKNIYYKGDLVITTSYEIAP
jgi:hypothetical protein